MSVNQAYQALFSIGVTAIGVCLVLTVIKSVIGPRISDRLVTVNMVGTLVTSAILMLSFLLPGESYLIDVSIIYVLISFLSVIVFTTVFINEFIKKQRKKKEEKK